MLYRYYTIIFRLFFVLVSWKFSNAAVPDWCDNPMLIKMTLMVFSQTDANNFESPEGKLVYLCQLDMSDMAQYHDILSQLDLFAIWNPENDDVLFDFGTGDSVTFLSRGDIYEILVEKNDNTHSRLQATFQNLEDFKNFHILINDGDDFTPQNFNILGLESYTFNGYNNDDILEKITVLHPKPAIFTQHFIENSNDFKFNVEDNEGSYLTFEPSKYKSARYPIKSDVILARSADDTTFYIISLDTPENALSFANYIGKFALPEPLLIPNELDEYLNMRI